MSSLSKDELDKIHKDIKEDLEKLAETEKKKSDKKGDEK